MSADLPCPLCIAAGVPHEEAHRHAHKSNDPKFQRRGRSTSICFRINKHPHGGPAVFYSDTGELVRQVRPSPIEWLYHNAKRPPGAWGITPDQLYGFGIRGLDHDLADRFRERCSELAKKLPSYRTLVDAEINGDPILLIPLYGEQGLIGLEVRIDRPVTGNRPGDSGRGASGKIVTIVGEAGPFISDPFPTQAPALIAFLEGGKVASRAAADALADDYRAAVFIGASANFRGDLVRKVLQHRFPGVPIIAIGDRDQAGIQFTAKAIKMGAIEASLPGCSGNDLADEECEFIRIEALKTALEDGYQEWKFRREARGGDNHVLETLRSEGLAFQDDRGNLKVSRRQVTLARILELDPKYGPNFRRNLMGMRDYLGDAELRDEDITAIQNDLDQRYGFGWSIEAIERQVAFLCAANGFNPIADYFANLPVWDGQCRIGWVLQTVLGAEASPLNKAMMGGFFRGAVARAMHPGCKNDVALVLKSTTQGVGKTSYFDRLVGRISGAFLEGQEDIQSKDALMAMHRAFIVEIGEMDRVTKSKDPEILKNFLSRRKDVIRPPYGRRHQDRERSFVVVGTTNSGAMLVDPTGHRRFNVIETGSKPFRLDLLEQELDQIWAQAVAEFNQGMPWWLDREMEALHKKAMRDFETEEPWEQLVAQALSAIERQRRPAKEDDPATQAKPLARGVSIGEILETMGVKPEGQNAKQANRVSEILRKRMWWRLPNQRRIDGQRVRLWFPPYVLNADAMPEATESGAETAEFPAEAIQSQVSHYFKQKQRS